MRRFYLQRHSDKTGVSGTGVVAEGVEFFDGRCVMRWRGAIKSTVSYDSLDAVEIIHGHNKATDVIVIDPEHIPPEHIMRGGV